MSSTRSFLYFLGDHPIAEAAALSKVDWKRGTELKPEFFNDSPRMAKILQWTTSRSWTRKANIEDIYHLRKDLALLEQSIAGKAKEAALRARADFERLTQTEEAIHTLHADLSCFRQHLIDLSSRFQTQLATLEQWVKSGAIEERVQLLCEQQTQLVEQLRHEHRQKISEIALLAETASSEIKCFS